MLRDLRRDRLHSLDDAGAGPPTGLDGGESCYALRYRSALGWRDDFGGSSDRDRATSMIERSVSSLGRHSPRKCQRLIGRHRWPALTPPKTRPTLLRLPEHPSTPYPPPEPPRSSKDP